MRLTVRHGAALVLLALVGSARADTGRREEYRLELDPLLQPEAGVIAVTTVSRLATRGLDELGAVWEPRCAPAACVAGRLLEWFLLDVPLGTFANILPHEVFGHGGRARELGLADHYQLSPPPPYFLFTGGADYLTTWSERTPALLPDERALLMLGGYEVEELQLRHLAFGAFRSGVLRQGDALIYLTGPLHLASTIATKGTDYSAWLDHLSSRYRARSDVQHTATLVSVLASAALDPTLLWSVSTVFYRFLVRGERQTAAPALELSGSRLAFTTRLLLVPWGREHELDLFWSGRAANVDAALRVGEGPGGASFGLSVTALDVWVRPDVRLGAQLDLFAQPRLETLSQGPVTAAGALLGAGGWVQAEYAPGPWFAGLRLGGKSAGLVLERPYAAAVEGHVSVGLLLPVTAR